MTDYSDSKAILSIRTIDDLCNEIDFDVEPLIFVSDHLRQYYHRYPRISKTSNKRRVIYDPQRELCTIQERIKVILNSVPLADCIHGWRKYRSARTNALPHVNNSVVFKLDLEDFFPNCHYEQVRRLFLDLGCSEELALLLTKLTTADYHLPQGFKTSPIIANLLLSKMDSRIMELAKQRSANYTRFGDDLAFSGPSHTTSMVSTAKKIIQQYGHEINSKKFTDSGIRYSHERQEICAVTVNLVPNLRSPDFQRYWQMIQRCIKFGPQSEMRSGEAPSDTYARLQGYINYVRGINRKQADRLQKRFNKIRWF